MTFNAASAAEKYQPRTQDADLSTFAARLKVCQECPYRDGQHCSALEARPFATVLARKAAAHCPKLQWPGDPQPAPPAPPTKPTDRKSLFRRGVSFLSSILHPPSSIRSRPSPTAAVSLVIAGRNYARFLPEALESALAQSHPCQVIYSDDCSLDDSVDVARSFEPRGVTVLTSGLHQGVAAARRRGFSVANGEWFLNLDADDKLPRDYVARMLAETRPGTPFVYAAAQAFGNCTTHWEAPPWGESPLWTRNFVNTCALYSRTAYHAAGGWQEGIGTMWDWDLALRAARFGIPRRCAGTAVLYRFHGDSFSDAYRERDDSKVALLLPKVRRRLARLSIGAVISDRLPLLFDRWLGNLAASVRMLASPQPVDLVLLTDWDKDWATMQNFTHHHLDTFDTIRILPSGTARREWKTEPERRDQVARFLAAACNRLKSEMRGDLHWIVEDDIFPSIDAAEQLLTVLTDGLAPPVAVTGCYRNRHDPTFLVGGRWTDRKPVELLAPPLEIKAVPLAGTGCLMYWRDRAPDWGSHFQGVPAHDWNWSMQLAERKEPVWMVPGALCGHARDYNDILKC